MKRRVRDVNQIARATIDRTEQLGKDPAAVALGRKGGLKGGRARMDSLTPAQRSQLARKAARARWRH